MTDESRPPSVAEQGAVRPAPLDGVVIVAVEQFGAGPLGTMFLADLGARVIKIEDPGSGGDSGRYVPPGDSGTDSLYFEAFNRNKESIALDLKSSAGRAVFERLVGRADAVFSNLRGDVASALRLGYRDLAGVNPAIVCVALTGYGTAGAEGQLPAYDALIQAKTGWAQLTGGPVDPPIKSGLSLVDYVGGMTSAIGLLAAIIDARRTGVGRDVAVNLYDAALSMLTYPATWYLSAGVEPRRLPDSAHPSIVPFQFFRTSDGYVAIACPKEKFWRSLVELVELPELADDPRFDGLAARDANRDELLPILQQRFLERSTDDWIDCLTPRVPAAPVRGMSDALDLEELTARAMLAEYDHPRLGRVRSLGRPFQLPDSPARYSPGPGLGADEEAILTWLGSTETAHARVRNDGEGGHP